MQNTGGLPGAQLTGCGDAVPTDRRLGFRRRLREVNRADVVLDGDRIAAVGGVSTRDEAVDCAGGLLVPGFIDCHTHVGMAQTAGATRTGCRARPACCRPCPCCGPARRGVTTVRDAWGADAGRAAGACARAGSTGRRCWSACARSAPPAASATTGPRAPARSTSSATRRCPIRCSTARTRPGRWSAGWCGRARTGSRWPPPARSRGHRRARRPAHRRRVPALVDEAARQGGRGR